MKEGWVDGQLSFKSSGDTLAVLHQATHDNEQAFKEKGRIAYNFGAQALSLHARDQVL